MNRGRKSYSEQTRGKLLDLWRGQESFGRPLGCVATTFTFDPALFEEQCLARFLSVQSNPNETAKAYLIEREEKLSQCFACVLVDQAHVAPDRSLRWHLLPVVLPGGGVQHAKISILVWQNCIRVLIGSANLTEHGYRKNQEQAAVLDFSSESGLPGLLLKQCVGFLDRVRRYAPGVDRTKEGPQAALDTFLRSIEIWADRLGEGERLDVGCTLVPLVPDAEQGRASVLDRLRAAWRGPPAPDRAWVLSPFYNEGNDAKKAAQQFAGLLTARGPRRVTFLAPGRKLVDEVVQLDAPAELAVSSHPSLTHAFGLVSDSQQSDGEVVQRPLHAKSIWLEREERALYMVGSSNFTLAGLGLHPKHNIELNLVYELRNASASFGQMCEQSYPEFEELKDTVGIQFLGGIEQSEGNETGATLLPGTFGLALFRMEGPSGRLELEIGQRAPAEFQILSRAGVLLLDSDEWKRSAPVQSVNLAWPEPRPPSALEVRWLNVKKEQCTAPWVVNVADVSALPPPEALRDLSLAELLEVLTSTRPIYETVARILDQRDRAAAAATSVEIDPHRKVDTSNFLLRRMRQVSLGLEGMRERLEQPVFSVDALLWRLRGPLGALALARRIAESEPDGAAFMISEVAVTLRSVAWQPMGMLTSQVASQEVNEVIRELHGFAEQAKMPDGLASYVKDTFEGLLD